MALGEFPETLRDALAERCTALGLAVVEPPYSSADLPGRDRCGPGRRLPAEFAIAETGTLVEFATDDALRPVSSLRRVHVGLFAREDLVPTLRDAAGRVRTFFE